MAKEITAESVFASLTARKPDSHKGSYGRVLVCAGSRRYRGAAALAAEGALRGGAGLVTLAAIEPVIAGALPRLPECILMPCTENAEGGIGVENLSALQQEAARSVVVCGPGMGQSADTAALVAGLIDTGKALVLDADGLNTLPDPPPTFAKPTILTPHPGEMARLVDLSVAEVLDNAAGIASGYARSHGCVVALKTHRTLVAGPEGDLLQNTTGNAGLARGGSGDILAGLCGAMLAQGLPPLEAAAAAVWLHGAAADACAAARSQTAMLPHDLFLYLGTVLAGRGR